MEHPNNNSKPKNLQEHVHVNRKFYTLSKKKPQMNTITNVNILCYCLSCKDEAQTKIV